MFHLSRFAEGQTDPLHDPAVVRLIGAGPDRLLDDDEHAQRPLERVREAHHPAEVRRE
jgi:hypothetical protein